jgi:hypothetical protein
LQEWGPYGDLNVSVVESSSLVFSNLHADGGDRESLLFIFSTLLGLGGLGLSPFGHSGSTGKLTLGLDLMRHVPAGLSKLSLSLDLDLEFLLEEDLAENDQFVAVGVFGGIILSFEFEAAIGLGLGVLWADDSLTNSSEGLGGLGKGNSSLVSGISRRGTEVESTLRLGSLDHVLDGGWVLGLEDLLDLTTGLLRGSDWNTLSEKGDGNDTAS